MTRQELIAALYEAEGPHRGLDVQITRHVLNRQIGVSAFTRSLDAAVGLARTAFPGWIWRIATCSVSDDAWLIPDFNCPVHGERLKQEFGQVEGDPMTYWQEKTDIDLRPSGRPAIAMCIAILTALEAIDEMRTSNNVERGSAFSPRSDASNGEV